MSINTTQSLSQVHSGVQPVSTEQLEYEHDNVVPRFRPAEAIEHPPGTSYVSTHLSPTDIIFGRPNIMTGYGPNTEELCILVEATEEAYRLSEGPRSRINQREYTGCTCKSRRKSVEPCGRTQQQKAVYNFRQRKNGSGEFTCILMERYMTWFHHNHRKISRIVQSNGTVVTEYEVCCERCDCVGYVQFLMSRFPMCDGLDCAAQH
jgi:hypothetical protein